MAPGSLQQGFAAHEQKMTSGLDDLLPASGAGMLQGC